jgi:hypothetical protein
MNLSENSKKQQAVFVKHRLVEMMDAAKIPHGEEDFVVDAANGRVQTEGYTFAYSGGHLVMVGTCPKCTMETVSKPIRRISDIEDLQENFKPAHHDCWDIN